MNWHLFSLIIAWPVAVVASFLFVVSLWFAISYEGSIEQKLDRIKGVRKTWPILPSGVTALISTAWIIAYSFVCYL